MSLSCFQFLLQDRKGKSLVEEYDKYENTPLHAAAKKGYVRIIQVSLDAVIVDFAALENVHNNSTFNIDLRCIIIILFQQGH